MHFFLLLFVAGYCLLKKTFVGLSYETANENNTQE
jgi:hypothetical protein